MVTSKEKILIFYGILILVLILSGCTSSVWKKTEIEPNYEMVKWGMTKDEVMKSESHEFIKEAKTEAQELLLLKGKIEDIDIIIMYSFINGKLINYDLYQDDQKDPSLTAKFASTVWYNFLD